MPALPPTAKTNIPRNQTPALSVSTPEIEISPDLNGLQPLLLRLDRRIQAAYSVLESESEAEQAGLAWWQRTGISLEGISIPIRSDSIIAWLQKTFNLSAFDLEILAIAFSPIIL